MLFVADWEFCLTQEYNKREGEFCRICKGERRGRGVRRRRAVADSGEIGCAEGKEEEEEERVQGKHRVGG